MEAINTPRLRLEPLEPEHAALLFSGLQEKSIYWFLDEAPPASLTSLEERYERLAKRTSPDGREQWLNWAVWSQEGSGYIGYVQATVLPDHEAEIAYVLFPTAWGHGNGVEAVRAMLDYLGQRLSVATFVARVHPQNRRSVTLLTRLGFVLTPPSEPGMTEQTSDDVYRL